MNLPNINIEFPDVSQLAADTVGYSPNPDLARVSDGQREIDKQVYQEQINAAANLRDSFKVAGAYVSAGIEQTRLGGLLIGYKVGQETVRHGLIQLDRAVVKTMGEQAELDEDTRQLNHKVTTHQIADGLRVSQIDEFRQRAELAGVKAAQAALTLNQAREQLQLTSG